MRLDASVIDAIRLKGLRTRILHVLSSTYPRREHSDILYLTLTRDHNVDASLRDVLSEVAYLAEKNLVEAEEIFEHRSLVRLTARGRDFLEGNIEEVGLESPASFRKATVLLITD